MLRTLKMVSNPVFPTKKSVVILTFFMPLPQAYLLKPSSGTNLQSNKCAKVN